MTSSTIGKNDNFFVSFINCVLSFLRNSFSLRHQIACQETQDNALKSAYRKQIALSVLISQSNELIFLPLLAKIDLFKKRYCFRRE